MSLLLRILTSISRLVSPPVFTIDISRGTARVQHGDVPGGLVLEFSDVARAFDIRSGTIRGVRAATWLVGWRGEDEAVDFLMDLRGRLANRILLTTDGHVAYVGAVERVFGTNVDYAQLIKEYGVEHSEDASPTARRYSPNKVTGEQVRVKTGDPDPSLISTSYVERNNLTMRMSMRRFTRLTNGFSKKVENHAAMVGLHFMHYNFARPHMSLGKNRTPAMAAGISDHVWTGDEIAALLND